VGLPGEAPRRAASSSIAIPVIVLDRSSAQRCELAQQTQDALDRWDTLQRRAFHRMKV
jgi:hypothetical protein